MALGALVKVSAALPAALLLCWFLVGQGVGAAVGFAAAALAVVSVALLAAGGRDVLTPLRDASTRFTGGSVWQTPRRVLDDGGSDRGLARRLSLAATASVVLLAGLLGIRRVRHPDPTPLLIAGVLAFMLLSSYVAPWYIGWTLPLLALRWRSPLAWLATAHAGLLMLTLTGVPLPAANLLKSTLRHLYTGVLPVVEVLVVLALVIVTVRELRTGTDVLDHPA
jgi:hypothetical protein